MLLETYMNCNSDYKKTIDAISRRIISDNSDGKSEVNVNVAVQVLKELMEMSNRDRGLASNMVRRLWMNLRSFPNIDNSCWESGEYVKYEKVIGKYKVLYKHILGKNPFG